MRLLKNLHFREKPFIEYLQSALHSGPRGCDAVLWLRAPKGSGALNFFNRKERKGSLRARYNWFKAK